MRLGEIRWEGWFPGVWDSGLGKATAIWGVSERGEKGNWERGGTGEYASGIKGATCGFCCVVGKEVVAYAKWEYLQTLRIGKESERLGLILNFTSAAVGRHHLKYHLKHPRHLKFPGRRVSRNHSHNLL